MPCAYTKKQQRENKEMKKKEEGRKVYCRGWGRWWYGADRRTGSIGIFLIIIGGLWLGAKLGLFNPDFFWPLAFIAVGIWIILSSVVRGKSGKHSK
jgi:hypothetical protein